MCCWLAVSPGNRGSHCEERPGAAHCRKDQSLSCVPGSGGCGWEPFFAFIRGKQINGKLIIDGINGAHYTGDSAYTNLVCTSHYHVKMFNDAAVETQCSRAFSPASCCRWASGSSATVSYGVTFQKVLARDEGTDGLFCRCLHFRCAKVLFQPCLVLFIHEFPLSWQVARLFFPNVVLSSGKFARFSPGPGISTCAVMATFTPMSSQTGDVIIVSTETLLVHGSGLPARRPMSSLTVTSPWLTPARY